MVFSNIFYGQNHLKSLISVSEGGENLLHNDILHFVFRFNQLSESLKLSRQKIYSGKGWTGWTLITSSASKKSGSAAIGGVGMLISAKDIEVSQQHRKDHSESCDSNLQWQSYSYSDIVLQPNKYC